MSRASNCARAFVAGLLALAAVTTTASGQSESEPRPSLVFVRYASHTSLCLYGAYAVNPWLMVFGMVQNPRSDYREAVAGVGRNFGLPGAGDVTIAVAGANASDSWYAQLYLVPTLQVAPVTLSGTIEVYAPLQSRGVLQYYVNPLWGHVRTIGTLKVGASYFYFGQHGSPAGQGLGPSLQVAIPHGTVTLDLVSGLTHFHSESRLTFQASF